MKIRFAQLSIAAIVLSFANGAFAAWQEIGQNEQTVVLVDTANPEVLEPSISPEKVIQVFDHRQLVFTEKFINAKKKSN